MNKGNFKVADVVMGKWFDLATPSYTTDVLSGSGSGTYTVEEWSNARKEGYNDSIDNDGGMSQLSSESAFFKQAMKGEFRKLLSARRFCRAIDIDSCQTIMDVGAGEMLTSLVIKSLHPEVRVVASDYDPYLIEKCQERAILETLERKVVDIKTISSQALAEYDVIVAWDVFYAFDSADMTVLFDKLKQSNATLVICSSQFIGPVGWLVYNIKNFIGKRRGKSYEQLEQAGKIRAHGTKYSINTMRKLAAKSGLQCKVISTPKSHDLAEGDTYTMVSFCAKSA